MAEAELQTFTSIMDALVRISSNMKSMEQELHCPVCDEMVKQPVLLPCQHSVCLLCAAEVLVQRGYPPPDLPPEPNSPASTPSTRSPRQGRRPAPRTPDRLERVLRTCGTYPGRRRRDVAPPPMVFPCPTCQQDVELGEKGLSDCLRNLTLERIVEYRHTVSLGSVAIMCGFCKAPQSLEATKGCADCKSNFCNECFKLYHPWGTPRAQHEHILPTNNFRPKVLTCTDHEQERLQWYCRSCQRLLCPLCKLRRGHHGHKVLPIAQAYQALKSQDKITKEVNFILANQETIQSQITQLEAAIKHMEANSAVALQHLTRSIRELGAAVAERQGTLALALEGSRGRREEALSAQVFQRQGLLEHAGLMAYTQELLKETDAPCFVQAARVTHSLVKAIENLQCFTLAADPSFRHFHLDASKEVKLINSVEFIQPLAPVIDTQKTLAYDQLFLCWRLPQDSAPAWHFSVEYQRRAGGAAATWGGTRSPNAAVAWQRLDEVKGTSAVVDRLQMDSVYVLRVRGCNKAGFGEYSEEVYLHTPPAPLSFSLDSRWGLHADRLALGRGQTYARSVPGLSLLQAADRALTSCHLTSDLLVADLAVTQGRHYWACSVEPGSYLVKVGVGQEAKLQEWFHLPQDMTSPCDPDSGHDSGAEDGQDSPPFCFLTMGMGKILLPPGHSQSDSQSQGAVHSHSHSHSHSSSSSSSHGGLPHPHTAPLPPRLGVCLDCDKGRVSFYDAHSLRVLWEGLLDCSAPVCPAFCFIGGGALQLQDLVADRSIEEPPPRRVTIQTRA
uniref:Tripartite motif containing 46 n=1 Tax=Amphiprion percula TaxID=161767 RepID=A0A3P8RZW0_AMPPE